MKTKSAFFNRFDIELPEDAVNDCCHVGDCSQDVKYWQPKIDLSHISDDDLIKELSEYGAWEDEELQDRTKNEQCIVWLAAGNIKDEENLWK